MKYLDEDGKFKIFDEMGIVHQNRMELVDNEWAMEQDTEGRFWLNKSVLNLD